VDIAFADALPLHLGRLLSKEEGVDDFLHWFNKAWWTAETSLSEDLSSFVARIETLSYILDSGRWTEDEFLAHLREETVARYGAVPNTQGMAAPRRSRVRLEPIRFTPPIDGIMIAA
jgi:hypothetical protein